MIIIMVIPVDNAAGLGATVKKGSQHAATFGAYNKVKKLVAPREGPDNAAGLGATVKKVTARCNVWRHATRWKKNLLRHVESRA